MVPHVLNSVPLTQHAFSSLSLHTHVSFNYLPGHTCGQTISQLLLNITVSISASSLYGVTSLHGN